MPSDPYRLPVADPRPAVAARRRRDLTGSWHWAVAGLLTILSHESGLPRVWEAVAYLGALAAWPFVWDGPRGWWRWPVTLAYAAVAVPYGLARYERGWVAIATGVVSVASSALATRDRAPA